MNKKAMWIVIGIILVIVLGVFIFLFVNKTSKKEESSDNNISEKSKVDSSGDDNKKILVAYYSAQGHTKVVAEKVAEYLDADIFEIVPKDDYTDEDLDWTDEDSRVSKEHNDKKLQDIELESVEVEGFDSYDTVLIGYPIWWQVAAWPVNNFVKNNDFTGKTVIPFCTSSSSGLGESGELLEEMAATGDWQEGKRFESDVDDSDVRKWTNTIK